MRYFFLFFFSILFNLSVTADNTVIKQEIVSIKGDANGDGVVNVADIVETVNYIMGNPSDKFDKALSDVNGDGTVNDEDIKMIEKIIFTHSTYKLMCFSPKVEMNRGKSASAKISFKLLHFVDGQWVGCPDKAILFSAKNGVCIPTSVKTDSDGMGQIIYTTSDDAVEATEDLITATCMIDQESGLCVNLGQITELPQELTTVLLLTANGGENHSMVTDKNVSIIMNLKNDYSLEGSLIETYPVISIQDDDALDYQLPQSYRYGATESDQPSQKTINSGGFASLFWPVLKALNMKHAATINGNLTCGVCAEGQRIGLTPLYGMVDTFDGELNTCGNMIKTLIEKEGWECVVHSMTARYVAGSYLVNGLDSEFANSLLVDAVYSDHNGLGWPTTTCYDTVTKKNYKVKQDLSGWDECPLHYAKPYLAVSKEANSRLVINPTYSVKYQVDTWMKRADKAGLPYVKIVVPWGSSGSSWHVVEDMKYVNNVVAGKSKTVVNTVPYMVCSIRYPWGAGNSSDENYNVYNKEEYGRLINIINTCVESNGWCSFGGHAYTQEFANYYKPAYDELYGADAADCGPLCYKDNNYPEEWVVPLNHDELMDMMGDNINDYWNNPPLHKRNLDGTLSDEMMDSWADWYPCPGTTLAMLYDALEYAISKGVSFENVSDIYRKFGNMFAIGFESIANPYKADARLALEDRVTSFCRVGADNSYKVKVNH